MSSFREELVQKIEGNAMTPDSKRSFNSINLAKMFFIYIVVVFHSRLMDGIVNHGYIGVEFFFIVSGFFLQKSVSNSDRNIISYARSRLIRLYPHYFFSFAVTLIVAILTGNYVNEKYNCIAEVFLLQNLGFTMGGVNYPCWYLSVLFWESLVLYGMLKYLPKLATNIIVMIFPILYYGYSILFADGRTEIWNTVYGVYLPLIRGMAGMSLGILIYKIYQRMIFKKSYKHKIVFRLIEVVSFAAIIVLIICPFNLDVITVMLMSFFVLAIVSEESAFEKIGKLLPLQWISKYEYAIFLNHAAILMLFKKYIFPSVRLQVRYYLLILLCSVTIYSIITDFIVSKLLIILKNRINSKAWIISF